MRLLSLLSLQPSPPLPPMLTSADVASMGKSKQFILWSSSGLRTEARDMRLHAILIVSQHPAPHLPDSPHSSALLCRSPPWPSGPAGLWFSSTKRGKGGERGASKLAGWRSFVAERLVLD